MCYAPRDVETICSFDMGSGESYSIVSFRIKVQRSSFGPSSERKKVRLGMNNIWIITPAEQGWVWVQSDCVVPIALVVETSILDFRGLA